MQSALAEKMILPFSSTCTIGGGNPFCLWKTSKNKQVITGSLAVIFQKADRVFHGRRGGRHAFC